MSYTPTEWQPDDIVTAARMNALETAVGELNMSYTPNTWVNGDVITAAKMNALEQAVAAGGGGGGGGDFDTAEVSVINNILSDATCYAATVVEPPVPVLPSTTTGFFNVSGNDTTTETVILYMGNCDMSFETSGTLSGSGDVEIDGTNAYITGDCTITIS